MPTEIVIHCPSNGQLVGSVAITPPEAVRAIVDRARVAQVAWAAKPVAERANFLRKVRARLLARQDDVVDCLARQNGKPRTEGLIHEVMEHLELLTYFADEGERILEPRPIPAHLLLHRQSYIHYRPRGVLGVVAPWNFPFTIPFGAVAMGLLAGNAVVVKPSEFTPLVADLGRQIYLEAGLDPELLHVIHGYGDVGAALIDGGVDMVEFTGSVATGRKVAAMCGERLIPCVTELGGKAPALVLKDANVERTAQAVTWGGLANAGQVCASIERLLVDDAIYDAFVPVLVKKVQALRLGDAMGTVDFDVGPLVNERQRDIVERLVNDAVAKGAKVAVGGKRVEGPGFDRHGHPDEGDVRPGDPGPADQGGGRDDRRGEPVEPGPARVRVHAAQRARAQARGADSRGDGDGQRCPGDARDGGDAVGRGQELGHRVRPLS